MRQLTLILESFELTPKDAIKNLNLDQLHRVSMFLDSLGVKNLTKADVEKIRDEKLGGPRQEVGRKSILSVLGN